MPGRTLSHREENLRNSWQDVRQGWGTTLRAIEVSGGTGLRGLDGVRVSFQYPISAICGPNGVGKTTILQLASLAHHSPAGWYVCFSNSRRKSSAGDRSYYTFKDFFLVGAGEAPPDRVNVTWEYDENGTSDRLNFNKSASRWGRYSSRPQRQSDLLPIVRVVPAYEFGGLRNYFSRNLHGTNSERLDTRHLLYMSYILSRKYDAAEVEKTERFWFERVRSGSDYTAFNMGSGEASLVQLLLTLQNMDRGGLLVIEEIELGLHPQALQRLVRILTQICWRKRIQIICSTHSGVFLDALPREARILLRKFGQDIEVYQGPSTRFAMFEMSGDPHPELKIYCEDHVAECQIRHALELEQRCRISIVAVGNYDNVIRSGVFHIRSGIPEAHLCIVDGDVTVQKVNECRTSATGNDANLNPNVLWLPGGVPPERWAVAEAGASPYLERLQASLGGTRQRTAAILDQLGVLDDHHDLGFEMEKLTALSAEVSVDALMNSIRDHPQLDPIRTRVIELID